MGYRAFPKADWAIPTASLWKGTVSNLYVATCKGPPSPFVQCDDRGKKSENYVQRLTGGRGRGASWSASWDVVGVVECLNEDLS